MEIAASLAAGKALRAAGTVVVEPVMRLEIEVPEGFLGAVAAAVTGRGGRIESVDDKAGGGGAPLGRRALRCLFGFAASSVPRPRVGRNTRARFSRFEEVPRDIVDLLAAEG